MLQLCSVPKLRYIWVINEADLSHAGADLPNDFRTKWSRHCPNVAVSFKDCEDHIASEPCDWMHGIIWEIQCKGICVSYYLPNNLKGNIPRLEGVPF